MLSYKTKYEKLRDDAKHALEELQFKEDKKIENFQEVCSKSLSRYDAEIEWYDGHADRRRFLSGAIRFIAVFLGTASILFINVRAFDSEFAKNGFLGLDLPAVATAFAIIAGGTLLLDLVFQITPRYARWRVMEYTIRILRTTFEVEFNKKFGALEDDKVNSATFNEAKILAIESFKEVETEIKAETESWQQNLDNAMKTLQQKIDKTAEEVNKTAKDVSTSTLTAEKERQKQEEQEKKKVEPVLLDVTLAKDAARTDPLTLVVVNKSGEEIKRKSNAAPGQTVPFSLVPGPYIFRLLDKADKEITSKSLRLAPATDETLSI